MRWCALIVLAACAGDDEPASTGETGETATPGPPTFSRVRAEVLPSCAQSACHAPGPTDNGLVLAPGQEYAALVQAPSEFADGEILVVPSDPDGSYVIKKLDDADGIVGDAMPPPLGNFDPRLYQLLRDWIEAGALDN